MHPHDRAVDPARRHFLMAGLALPAAAFLNSCGTAARPRAPGEREATHNGTEGPYYRLCSPEKPTLVEAGVTGTAFVVTGRVLSQRGQPLANTLIDFWHADDSGLYDLAGYRLRGHQFTDREGRYRLTTVVPGLYPGRTRHLHAKVQPPREYLPEVPAWLNLTTQLYFPGEARNDKDRLFDPACLMAVESAGAGKVAQFDFVLDVA